MAGKDTFVRSEEHLQPAPPVPTLWSLSVTVGHCRSGLAKLVTQQTQAASFSPGPWAIIRVGAWLKTLPPLSSAAWSGHQPRAWGKGKPVEGCIRNPDQSPEKPLKCLFRGT